MKLINAADYEKLITKKLQKSLDEYRPDVTHRALLSIIDSPLYQAGHVKILVKTKNGELINFMPAANVFSIFQKFILKLPRSEKRFNYIMAQVLEKRELKSDETEEMLIEVVDDKKVTDFLHPDTVKVKLNIFL